jgi:signal transduction histidine kinase
MTDDPMTNERLHDLALFAMLTDDELDWLRANSRVVELPAGAYFYREGEPVERFYVVLDGELQVTRRMNGVERVMGTTPRGIMGGELALLNMTPSGITSRAIRDSRLLTLDARAFRETFTACPPFGLHILRIAAERMANTAAVAKQSEKLAALGKFSAGLAHELNNPASAARRAADELRGLLPALLRQTLGLCLVELTDAQFERLMLASDYFVAESSRAPALSTLEQADREDAMNDWLDARGVANAWEVAPVLVSAGVEIEALETLVADLVPEAISPTLGWLCTTLTAARLMDDVGQSSARIAELVRAIKEYTYMDQGALQLVDLNKALDSTLRVMSHKLKQVRVLREYDPMLPAMLASGGELNQVWTNLIDNAVDAMNARQGAGTLRVITRAENDFAMVEIADDGPGIPPDVLPRIFEPFFTTKGVGEGTGLGLDIVYRIIQQHAGTVEVQSEPGNTRFIVRLPTTRKDAS